MLPDGRALVVGHTVWRDVWHRVPSFILLQPLGLVRDHRGLVLRVQPPFLLVGEWRMPTFSATGALEAAAITATPLTAAVSPCPALAALGLLLSPRTN